MSVHKYILNLHFYEVGEFNEKQFRVVDDPSILKQYKHLIHKLDVYKVDPVKTIKKIIKTVKNVIRVSDGENAVPYEKAVGRGLSIIHNAYFFKEDMTTAFLIDEWSGYGNDSPTEIYLTVRGDYAVKKLLNKKKPVLYLNWVNQLQYNIEYETELTGYSKEIEYLTTKSKLIKRLKEIGLSTQDIKALDIELFTNENMLCGIYISNEAEKCECGVDVVNETKTNS